jgi:hypothetical protein
MNNKFIIKITIMFTLLFSFSYSQPTEQDLTIYGQVTTIMNGIISPVSGAIIQNNYMNSAVTTNEEGLYEWAIYLTPNQNHVNLQCIAEGFENQDFTLEFNSEATEYEVNFTLNHVNITPTVLSGQVIAGNGCLGGPIGCPISNATIEAIPMISTSDEVYVGLSNDNGHFEIEIPTGGYYVTCSAEGWISQSEIIEIGENGSNITFQLSEHNQEIALFGYIASNNSTVTDSSPIGGAIILLHNQNGEILADSHSGDNGYYSFGNIALDASFITVEADGYEGYENEIAFPGCDNTLECDPLQYDIYLNPLDDYMLNGVLYGYVSAQYSPSGPEMLVSGATILINSFTSANIVETYETHSDENGFYSIELPAQNSPYNVTCHSNIDDANFAPITVDVEINEGHEVELNFHFNSWVYEVPPPVDLTIEIFDTPLGGTAHLIWEYPYVMIPELFVNFKVYFLNNLNPTGEWDLIGDTFEYSYDMTLGDYVETTGCFKVTAEINGDESLSSNIACIGDPINEDGVIYGSVTYIYGDIAELVGGVPIIAQSSNAGTINNIYETHTNEMGMYELLVEPGHYIVTASLEDGQTVTHDVFVNPGHEEQVNFLFYSEVPTDIIVQGNIFHCWSDDNVDCNVDNGEVSVYQGEWHIDSYEFNNGFFEFTLPFSGHYTFVFEADGYNTEVVEMFIEYSISLNIEMTATEADAFLIVGNLTASPFDTIRVPLYLETTSTFAGLQFMAGTEQQLFPIGFESTIECFTTNFGEVYGQLFGLMFSLEGCVLEPGEHHIANMLFEVSPWTENYGEVEIELHNIVNSNADAIAVPTIGVSGIVQLGLSGDVNADSEINVIDIVAIVNIILMNHEPNEYEQWAGDLTNDGEINVLDVVSLVNSILVILPMENNSVKKAELTIDNNKMIISNSKVVGFQLFIDNEIMSTNLNESWIEMSNNNISVFYSSNLSSSSEIILEFTNPINDNFELLLSDVNGNEIDFEKIEIPNKIVLGQNYPNPFNPTTNISIEIPFDMKIQLNIYNTNGELIEQLANGFYNSGVYNFDWNVDSQISSGIYIYKLITPQGQYFSKMILMK